MSDPRHGYGLVRRCRLEEQPMVIKIGEVTVTLTRLGTETATVNVKAPPDMTIEFEDGRRMHDTVEQALEGVLKGEH